MSRTVLVTGGAGFIGSHVVARLLEDGASVRIVDNLSTGKHENLLGFNGDWTLHAVSITDMEAILPIFEGVDTVFHIAALPSVPRSIAFPQDSNLNNVNGTLNVLNAARLAGVRRVVYAASSSVYGNVQSEYKSEDMLPNPLSPYGAAKLAGEYYCKAFTASYGLETVITRFFNVFGARQDPNSYYSAVIPKFIATMRRGTSPIIYGDGTQSRDFTYVANVVHGLMLAADAPQAVGRVFNIAMGGRIELVQLVTHLNQILGTDITPEFAPRRQGDILHSCADIRHATDLLGYTPIVDFETGLRHTVDWYMTQQPPSYSDNTDD
ncbi:MAG: SDR family oxidoreductase [Phototrophicaceae bacterium]